MRKKKFTQEAQKSVNQIQDFEQPSETEVTIEPTGMHIGSRLKEARSIPIDKIKPDPNQPRKAISTETTESFSELVSSIQEHGILQPITVEYIEKRDYFKIIYGERRYRAARQANLTALPCIVRSVDKEDRLAQQLIENIHREDLNPVDKARGLIEFKVLLGKEWKEVEQKMGLSRRRRQQFTALLNLPENIQKEIVALGRRPAKNQVTEKHARALLKLNKYPNKQLELFKKIKNNKKPIAGDEAIELAKELVNQDIKPKERIIVSVLFEHQRRRMNFKKEFSFDNNLKELISQLETKIKSFKKEIKKEGWT